MPPQPQNDEVRSYFDGLASLWTRNYAQDGVMRYRVDRFRTCLAQRLSAGQRVLDLGCGTGDIAAAMAGAGYRVTACDIAMSMLLKARERFGATGLEFVRVGAGRPARLPFRREVFDAVIASSVLEYVDDPEATAREIHAVMRRGGWLLATLPDSRHPTRRRESRKAAVYRNALVSKVLGRLPEKLRIWLEYDYLKLSINRFEVEGWIELFRRAGFSAEPPETCTGPLFLLACERV